MSAGSESEGRPEGRKQKKKAPAPRERDGRLEMRAGRGARQGLTREDVQFTSSSDGAATLLALRARTAIATVPPAPFSAAVTAASTPASPPALTAELALAAWLVARCGRFAAGRLGVAGTAF